LSIFEPVLRVFALPADIGFLGVGALESRSSLGQRLSQRAKAKRQGHHQHCNSLLEHLHSFL
jgi:hypothetical protein